MDLIELKANIREKTGNGPARVLRREGMIPAVLYGPDTEPILLSVAVYDLEAVLKTGTIGQLLVNIVIENGKQQTKTVMIKELQTHPVSRRFVHADFYEVDMNRKIRVNVPVVTTGKSAGVEMGGMLQIIRRELEVLCLPNQIPNAIEIDIAELNMGDSVHVKDIPLEGDVEIPAEVNFTVLTILAQRKEEVEAEEEGIEGEEAEAEAPSEEEA